MNSEPADKEASEELLVNRAVAADRSDSGEEDSTVSHIQRFLDVLNGIETSGFDESGKQRQYEILHRLIGDQKDAADKNRVQEERRYELERQCEDRRATILALARSEERRFELFRFCTIGALLLSGCSSIAGGIFMWQHPDYQAVLLMMTGPTTWTYFANASGRSAAKKVDELQKMAKELASSTYRH